MLYASMENDRSVTTMNCTRHLRCPEHVERRLHDLTSMSDCPMTYDPIRFCGGGVSKKVHIGCSKNVHGTTGHR
uniref:Uncharacterized protein n=1 Tax=Megaselia scalaris TaxID=36166 RepID=T1GE35_MEGSC